MFWRTPLVKRGELCFCRNYLHNFPWSVFSFLHSPLVKHCRLRWSFSVVCSSHQPGPCLHKYLNSWCQHQHPPHHTSTPPSPPLEKYGSYKDMYILGNILIHLCCDWCVVLVYYQSFNNWFLVCSSLRGQSLSL